MGICLIGLVAFAGDGLFAARQRGSAARCPGRRGAVRFRRRGWVGWLFVVCCGQAVTALQAQQPQSPAGLDPRLPPADEQVQPLLQAGQVRFDFYDVRPREQEFDGRTQFQLDIDYQFRYQSRSLRRANRQFARLGVHFTQVEVKLANAISLPASLIGTEFWENSLVQHELQHVRINSDPRVKMLTRELLHRLDSLELELAAGQSRPTESQVQEAVESEVAAVIQHMTELLLQNNGLLDRITQHGLRTGDFDPNFFHRLYTLESLEEAEFPRLAEVQQLLRRKSYRKASQVDGW